MEAGNPLSPGQAPRGCVVTFSDDREPKCRDYASITDLCADLGLVNQAVHGPGPSAFKTSPTADTITRLRDGGVAIEGKAKAAKGKIESIKIYNNESKFESSRYHVLYVEAQDWFPMYLKKLKQCGVYVADIHIPLLESRDLSQDINKININES